MLLVAPFPPRLDGRHGGSRAVAGLAASLAQRNMVAVAYLRATDEPPIDDELAALCDEVLETRYGGVSTSSLRPFRRTVPVALRFAAGLPLWAAGRQNAAFARQLRDFVPRWRPDVVQLEFAAMTQYLDPLPRPVPWVVTVHEPGTAAARERAAASRGLLRHLWAADARRWRAFEARKLREIDAAVIFTPGDRIALEGLPLAPRRLVVIPPAVPVPVQAANPAGADPAELLFAGSFVHPPNLNAAHWLMREIVPLVRSSFPHVQVRLVGEGSEHMNEGASSTMIAAGWVENLAAAYDRAAIVVAPIRLGGGARVKVAEALAAGKAVVGTSLAFAGWDITAGEHALVADDAPSFAAAITGLLADRSRRVKLGTAARDWAVRHIGYERTAAAYEALYDSLIREVAAGTSS